MGQLLDDAFDRYEVRTDFFNGQMLGQNPILIEKTKKPHDELVIEPYGRFGNNFYQILHAFLVARRLRIREINISGFVEFEIDTLYVEYDTQVECDPQSESSEMSGCFFTPYGFENLVQSYSVAEINRIIAGLAKSIYHKHTACASNSSIAVMHFRGGDVFRNPVPPIYVQPPVSYYIAAYEHACKQNDIDALFIRSEDRSNPALQIVETELRHRGVYFQTRIQDLISDVRVLTSAKCLISSPSTLCEAASLLSKNIGSYYSFRGPATHPFLRPFMQSKFGDLLAARDVSVNVIDDYMRNYIPEYKWNNSFEQRAMIINYPRSQLRRYNHLLPSGALYSNK